MLQPSHVQPTQPRSTPILIGITGTDGAGKGTVVEYLVEHKGFAHYSARALFEEVLHQRGEEATRENLRLVGNELRRQFGNDYMVVEYINLARRNKVERCIIESIRAIAEAETLKAAGGILWAVDADAHLRYERISKRQLVSDTISFDEFQAHERLEMNDTDPNGMQKAAVMKLADYTLTNDGTLQQLHHQIDELLLTNGI